MIALVEYVDGYAYMVWGYVAQHIGEVSGLYCLALASVLHSSTSE